MPEPSVGFMPLAASSQAVTVDMAVVFLVVLGAIVLFLTEWLPIDVTAIAIMATLIVLEPWTGISPAEGIAGFSSPATITILAMLILSSGVSQTGLVQIVGRKIAAFAGNSLERQLLATIGVAGPSSGFVNNTPVVALLVPIISDVAHEGQTSPSKLLIPLSYAAQLGGMLTLIGTSTNILASDTAARLSTEYPSLHAFDFFEFTVLGVIVLLTGSLYLLTIGHRLLPERVQPREDYVDEYGMAAYLSEVEVLEDSALIGEPVEAVVDEAPEDVAVMQLVRGDDRLTDPLRHVAIEAGDVLVVRGSRPTVEEIASTEGVRFRGTVESAAALEPDETPEQRILEVVIPASSSLVGETLASSTFQERYDATVLAFRTRKGIVREQLEHRRIRAGDTLLIQAETGSVDRLARNRDFILAHEADDPEYRTEKIPHAIAIMVGVVGLVAIPWGAIGGVLASLTGIGAFEALAAVQQDILTSALIGVVAMVLAGVLHANELYDAVDWNVIFLIAGVIPLGMALEGTGAAMLLGQLVASAGAVLPVILVLWLFYIVTGLITEVISNNASIVLMIPVAAAGATAIDANPFAFVLAVTFAASTAFLGPVGYQTNLFVYGPGGYRFTDYIRIGAPLQLLLSTVTVVGIALLWGL